MAFHYLPAKCEPNARAGNFLAVQTLEHAEYELGVRRINADAVISHREGPPFSYSHGGNVYDRCHRAPIFDRIANQVLEKLHQHGLIVHRGRQRIRSDRGPALLNDRLEG